MARKHAISRQPWINLLIKWHALSKFMLHHFHSLWKRITGWDTQENVTGMEYLPFNKAPMHKKRKGGLDITTVIQILYLLNHHAQMSAGNRAL